jgi:hypothetical protein
MPEPMPLTPAVHQVPQFFPAELYHSTLPCKHRIPVEWRSLVDIQGHFRMVV